MRSGTKTNYSPIRQTNYIDKKSPIEIRDFPEESNVIIQQTQQQDFDTNQQIALEEPKEVYIYDCCGVSRELDHTIKFMSTFRALFFLFNLLVFTFGLADFGMGLWLRIDPKVYEIHKYIETQNFTIAGWVLLFGGFAVCIVALVGFGAAASQAAGILVCYFATLIFLTLTFVGTLVLLTIYGFGQPLEKFLIKEVYEQIRRRSMNTELDLLVNNDAVLFLDFIQVKMRCCGAADFRDYEKLGMVVPTSCYTIDRNFVNAHGCGRAIRELFDIRAGLAASFTLGSIITQLATIILSALMFCSIYHWLANPRPTTPPISKEIVAQLQHQRPRSRTPIVI